MLQGSGLAPFPLAVQAIRAYTCKKAGTVLPCGLSGCPIPTKARRRQLCLQVKWGALVLINQESAGLLELSSLNLKYILSPAANVSTAIRLCTANFRQSKNVGFIAVSEQIPSLTQLFLACLFFDNQWLSSPGCRQFVPSSKPFPIILSSPSLSQAKNVVVHLRCHLSCSKENAPLFPPVSWSLPSYSVSTRQMLNIPFLFTILPQEVHVVALERSKLLRLENFSLVLLSHVTRRQVQCVPQFSQLGEITASPSAVDFSTAIHQALNESPCWVMLKMKSRTVVLIYFYKDVCNSQGEKYSLWLIVRNFQTFESFALGLWYGRKAQMNEAASFIN